MLSQNNTGMQGLLLMAVDIPALLLVAASLGKIANPDQFRRLLAAYDLLPRFLVGPLALILPFIEFGSGLWLIGRPSPWVIAEGVFLYVTFASAVGINLIRGRVDLSCGCFGSLEEQLTWFTILRNVLCGGLLAFAWIEETQSGSALPLQERAITLLIAVLILGAAFLLKGAFISSKDLDLERQP